MTARRRASASARVSRTSGTGTELAQRLTHCWQEKPLEYLIRVERVSRELVLSFSEAEESCWREAARKLFDSAQSARGEAVRLAEAAPVQRR